MSPFSKDFQGVVAQKMRPTKQRAIEIKQPPKNARAVLQQDPPMKLAKLRRGSI